MSRASRWQRFYERADIVSYYSSSDALKDAEPAILERMVSAGLDRMSMLDLGVGTGRTTLHFGARAHEYVGVDVARGMIEACRERFRGPEWSHASFEVCDARDMRMVDAERFDFALFSWNGLDAVGGEEDRLRALREIERVCAPGATFCFSSHNLASLHAANGAGRAKAALLRLVNPSGAKLERMGSAPIVDTRRGLRLFRNHYIRPQEQLRQLEEVGFRDPVALTATGEEVRGDGLRDLDNQWLYYLAWR